MANSGFDQFFSLDGVDVTALIPADATIGFNPAEGTNPVNGIGQQAANQLSKIRNYGFSFPLMSNAASEALFVDVLMGNAEMPWIYGPNGNAAGDRRFSGTGLVTMSSSGPGGSFISYIVAIAPNDSGNDIVIDTF